MSLTLKQVEDICLINCGDHRRCRYLGQDDDTLEYFCMKKSSKKDEIDNSVENFIRETKKKGKDPTKDNIALGDNCEGYIITKYKKQGIT